MKTSASRKVNRTNRTTSIAITFSNCELNDDCNCPPVKQINKWLQKHGFAPLNNLLSKTCSNQELHGNSWPDFPVVEFFAFIGKRKWKYRRDVRVLMQGTSDSEFRVFDLGGPVEMRYELLVDLEHHWKFGTSEELYALQQWSRKRAGFPCLSHLTTWFWEQDIPKLKNECAKANKTARLPSAVKSCLTQLMEALSSFGDNIEVLNISPKLHQYKPDGVGGSTKSVE